MIHFANLGRKLWILKPTARLGTLELVELEDEGNCYSVKGESSHRGKSTPKLPPAPYFLPSEHQVDLHALLWDYQIIFSHDGDFGCTHLTEHEIHTERKPVWMPYHWQNPHFRQEEDP